MVVPVRPMPALQCTMAFSELSDARIMYVKISHIYMNDSMA